MPSEELDLVFKTNESARVEQPEQSWWQWTQEHVAFHVEVIQEAMGRVVAHERRAFREEIGLLKRELTVLKEEVAVERGLKSLQTQIDDAKADTPRLPDIEARVEAAQAETKREIARLRRALEKAQSKISDLQVEASQTEYVLREMEKEKRVDTQTLDILKQCAEQRMEDHKPAPEPVQPPFVLPLQLEYINGTTQDGRTDS